MRTLDWHYAITFVAAITVFFTIVVWSPWLIIAALVAFLISLLTAPFDPRYP